MITDRIGLYSVLFPLLIKCLYICADVPDDILEQLKRLKDGLDAINKWKEEVLSLSTWLGYLCKTGRLKVKRVFDCIQRLAKFLRIGSFPVNIRAVFI